MQHPIYEACDSQWAFPLDRTHAGRPACLAVRQTKEVCNMQPVVLYRPTGYVTCRPRSVQNADHAK